MDINIPAGCCSGLFLFSVFESNTSSDSINNININMSLSRLLNSSALGFGPSRNLFKLLDDPFFSAPLSAQFQSPFASSLLSSSSNDLPFSRTPNFDVKETEKEFILQGELPGVEKKDLDIEFVDPQTLRVKGVVERSQEFSAPTDPSSSTASSSSTAVTATTPSSDLTPAAKSAGTTWASERVYGEFQRAFRFPSPVDTEHVAASLRNGILNVKVPKAVENPTAKRIEVQTEE
ncbi:HSP20-like chaperone [Myxozyma melibiosi]|uniref:HSP20-like chaperone n=1 Tax=Myxozyma melibiosi TaxID=54550 RepID=A0ABR1EYF1_9ASCO